MHAVISVRWMFAGTLAMIGGHFLITLGTRLTSAQSTWLYLAGALVSGAVVGALMVRHAVVRPWREPIFVSVLAMGLLAGAYLVSGFDATRWLVPRTSDVWLPLAGAAVSCLVGTLGGAMLARRARLEPPRLGTILVTSLLVGVGVYVVIALVATMTPGSDVAVAIAVFGGCPLAGFVTQLVVPARQPWACGAGWFVLVPLLVVEVETNLGATATDVVVATVGGALIAGILTLAGYLGARLAWWWFPPVVPDAHPAVAPARLASRSGG